MYKKVISAIFIFILTFGLSNAYAIQYATKNKPQTVSRNNVVEGQSYGDATAKNSSINVSGYIRDLKPGGDRIYVRATKTISARHTVDISASSDGFNSGYWSKFSFNDKYDYLRTSYIKVRTCIDVPYWFDPCSSSFQIYKK